MRLKIKSSDIPEYIELQNFSNLVLNIGNGLLPATKKENEEESTDNYTT